MVIGTMKSLFCGLIGIPFMLYFAPPWGETLLPLWAYWPALIATAMWTIERIAFFSLIRDRGAVYTIQAIYVSTPAAVLWAIVIFGGGTDIWLWTDFGPLPEPGPVHVTLAIGSGTHYCVECGGEDGRESLQGLQAIRLRASRCLPVESAPARFERHGPRIRNSTRLINSEAVSVYHLGPPPGGDSPDQRRSAQPSSHWTLGGHTDR